LDFEGPLTDIVSWFLDIGCYQSLGFSGYLAMGAVGFLETVSINQQYKNTYPHLWIQEQNCPISELHQLRSES
jgi:hypothetical protein